jgi:hypothetical protein
MQDLERVVAMGIGEPESHKEMALACSQLSGWIDAYRDKLTEYTDYNSSSKVINRHCDKTKFRIFRILYV